MNTVERVNQGRSAARLFPEIRAMIGQGWVRTRFAVAALIGALAASCANAPALPPITAPGPKPPSLPVPPVSETGPILYRSSGHVAMDLWRADFSARLLSEGHDRAIIKSLLENISPMPLWLGTEVQTQSAPSEQAEFAKPIWEYLRVPMGQTRINTGRQKMAALSPTLAAIETAYGVDRQVLVAIWGMETSHGAFIGRDDAANALANMATEGRRQRFAEEEIIALIRIIESGKARRSDLVSGWAGAMGHTQFMPSTFMAYAVDFDGDGRIDLWRSEADALASAANYLARSGYRMGEPWGIEVLVPPAFNYMLADGTERPLSAWIAAGLAPIAGGSFTPDHTSMAELWLPAGAEGPKFLLLKNFNVFKTYNRADSYALAVGLSADAVAGRVGPVTPWPVHLPPLTVSEIRQLQAALNARGFDAGAVDGIAGRRTRRALQAFQQSEGLLADGYPTKEILALLQSSAVAAAGTN